MVTIVGYGSLLSEQSSRVTFPGLTNFRLGRIDNYRRVFQHPGSIFFKHKIANYDTLEFSSLSVEPCKGYSLIVSIFEVPDMVVDEDGIPGIDFLIREETYDFVHVPYRETLDRYNPDFSHSDSKTGVLCKNSTDEAYLKRWGQAHFDRQYKQFGIDTIWGWSAIHNQTRYTDDPQSIRPCAVYLRHCCLAAKSMGVECWNSFLDETYLVDRETTIRQYLEDHPHVMDSEPTPELRERYSG